MYAMPYDQLFTATLSMFCLTEKEGKVPSAKYIQNAFKEVLKAKELCYEDYRNHTSTYEKGRVTGY